MPPRTRSRIVENHRNKALLLAGPVNTRGLPSFPTELLLEIASHYTSAPIPYPKPHAFPYPITCLARHETLRALSQTCRSLRSVFLPEVWRTIEACASRKVRPLRDVKQHKLYMETLKRDMSEQLVNQLEIVTIRDPSLAQYVRTVSVMLLGHSFRTVLAELIRCLLLFPDLRTLQIIGIPNSEATFTKELFANVSLPTVRTLVVSGCAVVMLHACPEVKNLTCIGSMNPYLPSNIAIQCKNLTKIGRFDLGECERTFTELVKELPGLEEISLSSGNTDLSLTSIAILAKLPKLRTIHMTIDPPSAEMNYNPLPWYRPTRPGAEVVVKAVVNALHRLVDGMPPLLVKSAEGGVERVERKLVLEYPERRVVYVAAGRGKAQGLGGDRDRDLGGG